MRIVDADAHVIEGRELMGELFTRFPDRIRLSSGGEDGALFIEGRPYPQSKGPGAGCPAAEGLNPAAEPFTADGVIRDADREGIDAMVFFPSATLGLPAFDDAAFAAEVARAYNKWLAAYCAQHPGRLYGVALVPLE